MGINGAKSQKEKKSTIVSGFFLSCNPSFKNCSNLSWPPTAIFLLHVILTWFAYYLDMTPLLSHGKLVHNIATTKSSIIHLPHC